MTDQGQDFVDIEFIYSRIVSIKDLSLIAVELLVDINIIRKYFRLIKEKLFEG